LRGPPMPGLGNPEERRSIPAVCRLGTFGKFSNSCAVRDAGGGVGTVNAPENWGETGDARLGDCDAEGDERDRFDDDDVLDADERDSFIFFVCRTGGGGA